MTTSRPLLAAPVSGFAAFMLGKVLDATMPARLVSLQDQAAAGRIDPERIAEVTAAWSAIREAGALWAQWRAAADDSTAYTVAAIPPRSQEIDTDSAAGLLGVTPNRVRQLVRAGELPGRKVARSWLLDRTAVELRREQ